MLRKTCEKLGLVALVLSASVGCDQTTKRIAEQSLNGGNSHSFFYDTVRLHYIQNSGAFLSLGSHFDDVTKLFLFILLPIMFLMGASLYIVLKHHLSHTHILLSALIIGGGLGNLIDRIFLDGLVTDFLNIGIGSLRTGIFNIADVAIMFGAFGLLWLEFRKNSSSSKNIANKLDC